MANTIKVLFWLHRSKTNKDGLAPLILRLTFQKSKVEKATGFYVNPDDWNIPKQRLKSNKKSNKDINDWIMDKVSKVSIFAKEEAENGSINLPSIIEKLYDDVKEEPYLLKVIIDHNEQLRLRVGKDYTYSTYEKYVFTYDKTKAFIRAILKKKDILLRDLTTKFIMDFDHYLRVNDNNQNNTAVKYCLNLKRILNMAVMEGLMTKNPFNAHKTVYKDTAQVYLSEAEVSILENAKLVMQNHILVRDLFLFQCYTGLAYTDMVNLEIKDISIDANGRKWIIKARQKSGVVSTIPLLPQSIKIIEKYKVDSGKNNKLFQCYSIQKYNQYIGQVGQLVKINKKLSSHVGRRTFGNVGLSKGLSLNVISKILGHSNTLITQRIYAITTQNIISSEIDKW